MRKCELAIMPNRAIRQSPALIPRLTKNHRPRTFISSTYRYLICRFAVARTCGIGYMLGLHADFGSSGSVEHKSVPIASNFFVSAATRLLF